MLIVNMSSSQNTTTIYTMTMDVYPDVTEVNAFSRSVSFKVIPDERLTLYCGEGMFEYHVILQIPGNLGSHRYMRKIVEPKVLHFLSYPGLYFSRSVPIHMLLRMCKLSFEDHMASSTTCLFPGYFTH